MIINIKMPRIGANDNYVKIGQWLVAKGDKVTDGDMLAVLETTKETTELIAEASGYIYIKSAEGDEIEVEQIIAHICETEEEFAGLGNTTPDDVDIDTGDTKITKKAADLAKKHNVDISQVKAVGIIREKDVKLYIDGTSKTSGASDSVNYNDIIIMCGGGMCKMVISSMRRMGGFNIHGVLDDNLDKGFNIMGAEVIGDMEMLESLYAKGYRSIVNAMGSISINNRSEAFLKRRDLYYKAKSLGFGFPNIIDPKSTVDTSAKMGDGNLVCEHAIVGADTIIGSNTLINNGCIVSHDCVIGSHTRISPGAVLAGFVEVGENSLIGMGVTIYMRVKIGKNVIISNGKDIFTDVPDNAIIK